MEGLGEALVIPVETINSITDAQTSIEELNSKVDELVKSFGSAKTAIHEIQGELDKLKVPELKVEIKGLEDLKKNLGTISGLVSKMGSSNTGKGGGGTIGGSAQKALTDFEELRKKIADTQKAIDDINNGAKGRLRTMDEINEVHNLTVALDKLKQQLSDLNKQVTDESKAKIKVQLDAPIDTLEQCVNKIRALNDAKKQFAKLDTDRKGIGFSIIREELEATYRTLQSLRETNLANALSMPEHTMSQVKAKIQAVTKSLGEMSKQMRESEKAGFKFIEPADVQNGINELTKLKALLKDFKNSSITSEDAAKNEISSILNGQLNTYSQHVSAMKRLMNIKAEYEQRLSSRGSLSAAEMDAYNAAINGIDAVSQSMDTLKLKYDAMTAASKTSSALGIDTNTVSECKEKIAQLNEALKEVSKPGAQGADITTRANQISLLKTAIEETRQKIVDISNQNLTNLLNFDPSKKSAEEVKQAIDEIRVSMSVLKKEAPGTFEKSIEAGNKKIQELKASLKTVKQELIDTGNKASELGNRLKYAFSLMSMTRYVKKLIKVRGEFEMVEKSLEVILKDADKASATFNELQKMAVKSPYTLSQISSQTKQLAAYRIEYEDLVPTVKMLGDVAAGTGVEMNRLILAYGQVRAAQFLKGTELRQFTEAGVDMLGGLSDRFTEIYHRAVSVGEVMKMISKRQVLFSDVKAVIEDMTKEGGTFFEMQEKQAETISGMISNIEDRISIMFNEIGKQNTGLIKGAIGALNGLLTHYREVGVVMSAAFSFKVLQQFFLMLRNIYKSLTNIGLTQDMIKAKEDAISAKLVNQSRLVRTMAISWQSVVATVATLGIGILSYLRNTQQLAKELEDISAKNEADYDTMSIKYRLYAKTASDATNSIETRRQALKRLQEEFGHIIPAEDLEEKNMANLNSLYDTHIELLRLYYDEKKHQAQVEAVVADTEKQATEEEKKTLKYMSQYIKQMVKEGSLDGALGSVISSDVINNEMKKVKSDIISGKIKTMEEAFRALSDAIDKTYYMAGRFSEAFMNFFTMENGFFNGAGSFLGDYFKLYFEGFNEMEQINESYDTGAAAMVAKEFEESKKIIDDFVVDFTKAKDDLLKSDETKYDKNDALLNIDMQKYLANWKDDTLKKIDSAYKELNARIIRAGLPHDLVNSFEDLTNKAISEANTGIISENTASTLKLNLERYGRDFMMFLDTNITSDKIKGIILDAMDVEFSMNDMSSLPGSLKTTAYDFAAMFRANMEKALATQTLSGFERTVTEWQAHYVESLKGVVGSTKISDIVTLKEDENEYTFGERLGKEWKKLSDAIKEYHEAETDIERSGILANVGYSSIQELEAVESVISEILTTYFPTLFSKFKLGVKSADAEAEKALNKQKKALKELTEKVVEYNDNMDKMAPLTKKMAEDVLHSLSEASHVALPKAFDEASVKDWLEKIRTTMSYLVEDDDILDLELNLRENNIKNEIDDLKESLDELWDTYEFAKDLEDMELHVSGFNTEEIIKQIVTLEERIKAIQTDYAYETAKESSDKRVNATRDATRESLRIAQEASRKAMSDTEQAMYDAFKNINKMIEGMSPQDTLNDVIVKGIKDTMNNAIDAIDKASWESFKASDTYVGAFDNLGGLDKAALKIIKDQLEMYKGIESLDASSAKAIAEAIQKIDEAMLDGNLPARNYFQYLREGFSQMKAAREQYATLPEKIEAFKNAMSVKTGIDSELKSMITDLETLEEQYALSDEGSEERIMLQGEIAASQAAITQTTKELEDAEKKADEAGKDMINTQESLTTGYSNLQKRIQNVTNRYNAQANTIEDSIELINKMADAFGLAFDDDKKEILDSFRKGFTLVTSALALCQTAMTAFGTEVDVTTGKVIALETVCWPLLAAAAAIGAIAAVIKANDMSIQNNIEVQADRVEDLQKAYEDLEKAIEKAFTSKDVTKAYAEQIQNINAQRAALQQMIALENSRGSKKDEDAIDTYNDQLEELKDTEEEALEAFYEKLGVDTDWAGQASDWASSWLEAFKDTGDGLESLQENFDEMFDDIIAQQINLMVMEPYIQKLKNTVEDIVKDGVITVDEMGEVESLRGELSDLNDKFTKYAEQLGISVTGSLDTESLQKGISTITETTAGVLESLITSMRVDVASTNVNLDAISRILSDPTGDLNPMLLEMKSQTRLLSSIDGRLSGVIKNTGSGDAIRSMII